MNFVSCARWPESVYKGIDGTHISTDQHLTFKAAKAVCNLLGKEGFGGEKKDFPISVWVTDEEGHTVWGKKTEFKHKLELPNHIAQLIIKYDAKYDANKRKKMFFMMIPKKSTSRIFEIDSEEREADQINQAKEVAKMLKCFILAAEQEITDELLSEIQSRLNKEIES